MICTLDEFRAYTGVTNDDAIQTLYLKSAEEIVLNFLGYDPAEKSYVTNISGGDSLSVLLKAKPVSTLTSVSIDGTERDLANFELSGETLLSLDPDVKFTTGWKNVRVEYTAGYPVADLPALIKMVILKIAALQQSESDGNIGVTSKSFGDSGNRTYVKTTDFSPYLAQIGEYKLVS